MASRPPKKRFDDGITRRNTRRSADEAEMLLEKQLASMTLDELRAFELMLGEIDAGESSLVKLASEYTYARKPVSMEEFLDDPYYLGKTTQALFPAIREDLIHVYDREGQYNEIIFGGALGWGKSFTASILLLRVIYELSCLRSPQLTMGLSPGSPIYVMCVSKTLNVAKATLKDVCDGHLKESEYFNTVFPCKGLKTDKTLFPNNLCLSIGAVTAPDRIIGLNVLAAAIDESNFMTSRQAQFDASSSKNVEALFDAAERLYTTISRRIKSRFMQRGGGSHGLIIMISSATTHGSFLERRVQEAQTDPMALIRERATWDVKPALSFDSWFRVLVGGKLLRSRVLSDEEHLDEWYLKQNDSYILKVPEEYRKDFENDLEGSLRDIAGVSTKALNKFIQRPDKIELCFGDSDDGTYTHPFSSEVWSCGQPAHFVWNRLAKSISQRLPNGFIEMKWTPLINPDAIRFVHIDPALTQDSLGVAMGHISRMVSVEKKTANGDVYYEEAPEIVIDFVLEVEPVKGEQIVLDDVRVIIYELIEHGFRVHSLSADSYQSADTLQQFEKRGVKTFCLSVDKEFEPYSYTRQAIYEERLVCYRYDKAKREAQDLEYAPKTGRVDHPPGGSKDVMDAIAGVVYGAMKSIQNSGFDSALVNVAKFGGHPALDDDSDDWAR